MTKERNRFDAVAEELLESDDKPKSKKSENLKERRIKLEAPIDENTPFPAPVFRAPKRKPDSPQAYVSVRGNMYPVIEFDIRSNPELTRDEEIYQQRTARRGDYTIEFKIAERIPRNDLRDMDDIMLVISWPNDDLKESHFYRLSITDIRTSMTARDSFTKISANAMQVA